MKTIRKMGAWWLRLANRKRLMKRDFETEPKLFYTVCLSIAGQGEKDYQEYLYIGKGYLLPTTKIKRRNNFLSISL